MDNQILKLASQRVQENMKKNQQKKSLPKPRSVTEVSQERLQEKTLEALAPGTGYPELDNIIKGFIPGHLYTLTGDTNVGKCMAKDSPLLMFDGSIKMVQDVVVGDRLMGPDNKPRTVLSLARGQDEMYEIKQQWGISYTVNKDHILSLKCSTLTRPQKYFKEYLEGGIINISVKDYLEKSGNFKKFSRGWFAPIDFNERALPIEPYFLGIWLGDGSSGGVCITTADPEVVSYLDAYAARIGLQLTISVQPGKTPMYAVTRGNKIGGSQAFSLTRELRTLGVLNNKHIPEMYRVNSRENRLALLAGIIDSDGWVQKNTSATTSKTCYSYAVSTINHQFAQDIVLLSRSLGFNARIREKTARMKRGDDSVYEVQAYTVSIQGNMSTIPVKIARKKITSSREKAVGFSSFKVVPRGRGDYYGFTLDGDGLYLLADCTVTHNTTLACNFAVRVAQQKSKTLYFALEPENTVVDYLASVRTNKRFDELTAEDISEDDGMIHIFGKEEVARIEDMIKIIDEIDNKYNLIVIDHIGYFIGGGSNWLNEQSNAIKMLAALAKRKQVAILIIAHLRKKQAGTKKDYTPTSDDIAGSGAFKQDSTEVMIVTRDVINPDDGGMEYGNTGKLYVTKTKCGPNGTVTLNFQERKANIYSDGELLSGKWKSRNVEPEDDWLNEVTSALF